MGTLELILEPWRAADEGIMESTWLVSFIFLCFHINYPISSRATRWVWTGNLVLNLVPVLKYYNLHFKF